MSTTFAFVRIPSALLVVGVLGGCPLSSDPVGMVDAETGGEDGSGGTDTNDGSSTSGGSMTSGDSATSSDALTGSTTDDPTTGTTGVAECIDLTPEDPGPPVEVTIRNDTDADLYLLQKAGCLYTFFTVEREGQPVAWQTSGWYVACEHLAGPEPSCGGPACGSATVRLAPGAEFVQTWPGVVFEDHELTPECVQVDFLSECGPNCYIERTPEPGSFRFAVEASTTIDCKAGECDTCVEEPALGVCVLESFDLFVSAESTADVVLDYPAQPEGTIVFE